MTPPEKWQCPDCDRSFKNENQWHSCTTSQIETHFEGKSLEVRDLFGILESRLREKLSFTISPLKTAIYFTDVSHFMAVFVRKTYLIVEFSNDIPFMDERIHRSEKVSTTLYSHFVKISQVNQIDPQLLRWISEAYELTAK